jgi:hypothetical protein
MFGPEMVRATTNRWISDVPSKIVEITAHSAEL